MYIRVAVTAMRWSLAFGPRRCQADDLVFDPSSRKVDGLNQANAQLDESLEDRSPIYLPIKCWRRMLGDQVSE